MKTQITLLITAMIALTACGSTAKFAGSDQQFQDGIYYRYSNKAETVTPDYSNEVAALAEKTRRSEVYLKSGQVDTLFIPENMSATLSFNKKDTTTTVTLFNSSDINFNFGYSPSWYRWGWDMWPSYWHTYGGWYSWAWDPWYGNPWYYNPWYYSSWYGPGWYNPWHYAGWYNPWYWDSWYYGGYYGPIYAHHWHYHGMPGGREYLGNGHTWGSKASFDGHRNTDGIGARTSSSRRINNNASHRSSSINNVARPTRTESGGVRRSSVNRLSSSGISPVRSSAVRATRTSPSLHQSASGSSAIRRPSSATGNTSAAVRPSTSVVSSGSNIRVNQSQGATNYRGTANSSANYRRPQSPRSYNFGVSSGSSSASSYRQESSSSYRSESSSSYRSSDNRNNNSSSYRSAPSSSYRSSSSSSYSGSRSYGGGGYSGGGAVRSSGGGVGHRR